MPLNRPDLLFTEETPTHTSSPYSASKVGAVLFVLAYYRTLGLNVTISRCSNNYNEENIRDWIHVHDYNIGVDLIVRNGNAGEVYNLGGHSEKTIVKIILKQLGK